MLRCTNYEKGVTIQWLACCYLASRAYDATDAVLQLSFV